MLLVNNWGRWNDIFKKKADIRPAKYTRSNCAHKKYEGWSQAGIAKYNQLFDKIQQDRQSPTRDGTEQAFLLVRKDEIYESPYQK